jgi:uncharacterized protein with GYD domain
MPKFLFETTYIADGIRGLQKDKGSGRKQAVEKLLASLDGKLEAFYYAMGEHDVVTIVDLPNAESAAAMSFAGMSTGMVRVKTTPLLTVEEVDRALSRKLTFRGPGQ